MGVLGASVLESLLGGIANHGGRLEIGLAQLEVNDVHSRTLEIFRPLAHLDGEEWLDHLAAPRHHPALPRRRRARRICHIMDGPSRSTLDLLPG